jgi:hypothetical protein
MVAKLDDFRLESAQECPIFRQYSTIWPTESPTNDQIVLDTKSLTPAQRAPHISGAVIKLSKTGLMMAD